MTLIIDKGNFKDLSDQVQEFVIEDGHRKPKRQNYGVFSIALIGIMLVIRKYGI